MSGAPEFQAAHRVAISDMGNVERWRRVGDAGFLTRYHLYWAGFGWVSFDPRTGVLSISVASIRRAGIVQQGIEKRRQGVDQMLHRFGRKQDRGTVHLVEIGKPNPAVDAAVAESVGPEFNISGEDIHVLRHMRPSLDIRAIPMQEPDRGARIDPATVVIKHATGSPVKKVRT